MLDGRADIAVHSAKDLPAVTPERSVARRRSVRADPADVLVGATLEGLAEGATVGTGSVRRRVQLAALRPDLEFVELRGNIDTRLGRLDELDAIIMASAALDRLGRTAEVVDRLDVNTMIPQVGQGALAIEARSDADTHLAALAGIEDAAGRDARCRAGLSHRAGRRL